MKPAAKACALVSLALVQFALPACGLFAPAEAGARTAVAKSTPLAPDKRSEGDRAPAESRKVGDFSVHRFSGSYQKAPLTLTEEVVGQEFGLWVIDYTFEEQAGTTKLRVRFNPRTESVFSVAKLDGAQETSVPISVYEQLIERTSFAADANDGVVAQGRTTCLVGPSELDCDTKTYKVRVGDQFGRLTVSHSDQVPSGDVTGDLIAEDGTVIYRSELLEMGNAGSPKRGVASR
ncbi:MAG: hypothetical protein ABIQ16_22795 [Polyangiaceae bacterium]